MFYNLMDIYVDPRVISNGLNGYLMDLNGYLVVTCNVHEILFL